MYEIIAGFAAFAVLGYLGKSPGEEELETFTVAFITYPEALARLPGSNIWAVLFFSTILLLGIDSAFGFLEAFLTVVTDTDWGKKLPRPLVAAIFAFIACLLSFMYTTEFGFYLLNAVDRWLTDLGLIFGMWFECVAVTTLYRYKDVVSQTGQAAFIFAQTAYVCSMVIGITVAHTVSPAAGGIVFALVLVIGILLSVFLSMQPEIVGGWGQNKFMNSLWWLTSYSVSS